jgi:cysteine desulfurase
LPHPILFGGGHEHERRAGTENVAAIAGLVAAAERFIKQPVFPEKELLDMTSKLASSLEEIPGVRLQGCRQERLSNTVSFTVEGCDSISLLAALDLEGVCASSGSACSAGSLEPSHVLKAMGVEPRLANSFVRFSLGRESTREEVGIVAEKFPKILQQIRGQG